MTLSTIDYGGSQLIGDRDRQEDSFGFHMPPDEDRLVCLLADGMGGHNAGDVASKLAIDTFREGLESSEGRAYDQFVALIDRANKALAKEVRGDPRLDGMGCTFIAVEISDGNFTWISVGDSIIYHLNEQALERVNEDHSMASRLDRAAELGEISWDEAKNSDSRNVLLSALSGDFIRKVDFCVEPRALQPGDWLIIASDGIEVLEPDALVECIRSNENNGAKEVSNSLIEIVDNMGLRGQDNTTILAVQILEDIADDSDLMITRPIRVG